MNWTKPILTQKQILEYEVGASWWASWFGCFHGLIGAYFAWKVKRKWRRYQWHVAIADELKAKGYPVE